MGRTQPALFMLALVALLALLPAPHPEARLFSGDWGASSFVDLNYCLTADADGASRGPRSLPFPRTPVVALAFERLSLALLYLLSGLALPMLALAAVFHPRGAARHPALLVFGLLGLAPAWFQWPLNPAYIGLRQWLADAWLANWPLEESQFAWLDGGATLLWLAGGTMLAGGTCFVTTAVAARLAGMAWRQLTQALLPLAGVTLLLGLTQATALYLRGEGVALGWLPGLRAALLAIAVAWSFRLGWRSIARVGAGGTAARAAASLAWLLPSLLVLAHGWAMYFHWTGRYHV